MRIGFLTTANSWHIPVRTKYFVSKGHEVFFIQIFPGTDQPIKPENVKCYDVKSSLPGFLKHLHKWFLAYRYSKKINLDVLHIIDMKYSYYSFFTRSRKIVLENNGSDVLILPKKYKWLRYIYKIIYKKADAVVQDSNLAQEAGIMYGAPRINNEIIELGIDFSVFNKNVEKGVARNRMGLNNEKIIFSPRGFTELYNIETIIKSIPFVREFYPDIKYVFCRHFGQKESFYDELIKKIGVNSNVIFTGFLDNEKELPYYYSDADIVISVPSSDSSPRSVYEAMACMTPVIISELPWYHNKFLKDKHVFVVPVGDEISLANKIIEFLNGKVKLNLNDAYKIVENKLSMIKNSIRLETLYKKMLYEDTI